MTNRAPTAQPRYVVCRAQLGRCHEFPDVAALLGHSENAHRLLNALAGDHRWSASEITPGLLMRISDEELLEIRNVGPGLVTWFRHRMDRLDLQHSNDDRMASPVWLTSPQWRALVDLLTAVEATPMRQKLLTEAATKIRQQMGWS
jgi:hypothetical protein